MSCSREVRARRRALLAIAERIGREAASTTIDVQELRARVTAACGQWPAGHGDIAGDCFHAAEAAARYETPNFSVWGRAEHDRGEALRESGRRLAAQQITAATILAQKWLALPSRWRAARDNLRQSLRIAETLGWRNLQKSLARAIIPTAAHAAARDGVTVDHRSVSGSFYLRRGEIVLRLSDHKLGFTDYGSRGQRYPGPEIVVTGDESPEELAAAIADALSADIADELDETPARPAAG